jgi:hypothetical protein
MTKEPELNSPNTVKQLKKQYKRAKKHTKIIVTKYKYRMSSSSESSGNSIEYRECANCQSTTFEYVKLCIYQNTERDCYAQAERCFNCHYIFTFIACQCPENPPVVPTAPAAPYS